jgi:hypothetical protein
MRWHKEGIRDSEDPNIMSHPADAKAWYALTILIQNLHGTPWVSILVYRWMVSSLTTLIVLHTLAGSFPHESIKHCWVVNKVNPEMDTHRYVAYMERHDDDGVIHVYEEENEGDQVLHFTVSDRGGGLIELATHDVELMEDELGPSKKHIRKSRWLTEK